MRRRSKKTDLAWVAGLIDGEGCLHAGRNNGNNGRYLGLHLTVQMCDRRAVKNIHRIAAIGTVRLLKPSGPTRRPLWKWCSSSQQAATFLEAILPYMVTKKPQAVLFIRLAREQKGKLNQRLTEQRTKFQDRLIKRIKDLKRVS
jgi:hypothetical protein